MTISDEQAKALRQPFPDGQIGKLPKPTKKENPKGRCQECGGYHGLPAVHLDYVGHAATTDRLLEADPSWTWEFLAANPDGSPVVYTSGLSDGALGIWIKLRIADVWTPGFGEGKNFKEAISDAIRNAAMRRGVALDLWSKEDLSGEPAADAADTAATARHKPAKPNAGHQPTGAAAAPSPDKNIAANIELLTAEILALIATDKAHKAPKNVGEVLAKHRAEIKDDLQYLERLKNYLANLKELLGAPPSSPFHYDPQKAEAAA